ERVRGFRQKSILTFDLILEPRYFRVFSGGKSDNIFVVAITLRQLVITLNRKFLSGFKRIVEQVDLLKRIGEAQDPLDCLLRKEPIYMDTMLCACRIRI